MTLVLLRVHRYECSGSKCADDSCFPRAEALGCDLFCRSDSNGDGMISQDEIEFPFLLCTGNDRGYCQSTLLLSIPHIIQRIFSSPSHQYLIGGGGWQGLTRFSGIIENGRRMSNYFRDRVCQTNCVAGVLSRRYY